MPNFAAAQTADNQWDYIDVVDLQDGTPIDGDTGVALSGTDDHRQFQVNNDAMEWVCAIASSYSAGAVTTKVVAYNLLQRG